MFIKCDIADWYNGLILWTTIALHKVLDSFNYTAETYSLSTADSGLMSDYNQCINKYFSF